MRTPPNDIKLRDLIQSLGLTHKNTSNSYIFHCPKCNKTKLYMHKKMGYFKCFVCADDNRFRGAPEFALAAMSGLSVREVCSRLYDTDIPFSDHIDIKFTWAPFEGMLDEIEESEAVWEDELEPTQLPLSCYYHGTRQFVPGMMYLLGRGITIEQMRKYNLAYDTKTRRVVFPIEYGKSLLGWQARYTADNVIRNKDGTTKFTLPKVLTSNGLRGGKYFMFWNNVIDSPYVVLCEGPVDALKAEKCGGNIASMGKGVTIPQLDALAALPSNKIYLALDPDAASDAARITRYMQDKAPAKVVYNMIVPKGKKDFGECTQEEVYQAFLDAQPVSNSHIFLYFKG